MKRTLLSLVLILVLIDAYSQNTVSELLVQGNKKTKSTFLKRLALVKPGTALDTLVIDADIRRLKLLPSIANASYKVILKEDKSYDVVYTLEENFTIIPGLNIATDNNGEFSYRLSLFEFNLLGSNQLIGGFYSKNVFDSYGAFWEAPYIFTRKLGIGISYQNLVSQEPVFFENDNQVDYRFDTKTFETYLIYEHNFHNRFQLGFNVFKEEYSFLEGNVPDGAPTELDANKTAIVGEYEYNNINIDYQYSQGFRSLLTYRFVSGGNDLLKNFFIGRNDFEYFKRIGEKGNFANRLRLGFATNDTTPFAPFAVDNQLNIRGAGNTIDRGTASIVLNTEYRHTLYERGWFVLQSNLFLDVGSWRNPGGDLKQLIDGSTIRFHPGAGIRFIHKRIFNAVFRLDYGYGIGDNASRGIVFGIGQYF